MFLWILFIQKGALQKFDIFLIFITIGQGGLTPSKCVKENIAERAAHIQTVMSRPESVTTPAKVSNTPGKVGSATKMMQQRLLEQAQHSKTDDIADRLRKDRMAELETLQKRYHNGILRDDRVPDTQVILILILILFIYCPIWRETWRFVPPRKFVSPRVKPEGDMNFMGGTNLHVSRLNLAINCLLCRKLKHNVMRFWALYRETWQGDMKICLPSRWLL